MTLGGGWMKTRRLTLEWTKQELARRAGVNSATVANVENGKESQLRSFLKIANTLRAEEERCLRVVKAMAVEP